MKPADYHLHTPLCKHAEGAPADYVQAAQVLGIPEVGFCDHCPVPDGYDPRHRMALDQFPLYREMISALPAGMPPTVLCGIEADYYEGCESFLADWFPKQNFDLVLGSVHYIGRWGFDNPESRAVWDQVDVTQTWRNYFALVARLADTRLFDVVAHLDLPKKFGYRPKEDALKEMAQPTLDRLAAAGMGVEINTSGLRRPVREIYPSALLLSLARERGIPITFGSDSHCPGEIGCAFDQAIALAREVGYTHSLRFSKRQARPIPLP